MVLRERRRNGRRAAFDEECVDAYERCPLLGERILREDRLDGALGLARAAVDAFGGVDHEHLFGLVNAVDRADVDAALVLLVDARLRDHVGHQTPTEWSRAPERSSRTVNSSPSTPMLRRYAPGPAAWTLTCSSALPSSAPSAPVTSRVLSESSLPRGRMRLVLSAAFSPLGLLTPRMWSVG